MSTKNAQAAIQTFLQIPDGNSPESFATVANVGPITGLTMAAMVVDVTSHSNNNAWRQKITTLLDPGTLTTDIYFVPNDSGHQRLQSIFFNRGLPTAPQLPFDTQLSYPTVPSRTVYAFSAWLSKFNMSAPVDGVIKAAIEIVATGEPAIPGVDA
jgi:tail tube protein